MKKYGTVEKELVNILKYAKLLIKANNDSVPYTFVVNGISYTGIYEFDNANWSKEREGLEYNLRVMNVTKDGKIEIKVTK